MPLENGKWRVTRGDSLWIIAKRVYNNGNRWTDIADANNISRKRSTIYPGQIFTLPGITNNGGNTAVAPVVKSGGQPAPVVSYDNKVKIETFALKAGSERDLVVVWSFNNPRRHKYELRWTHFTHQLGINMIETAKNEVEHEYYAASPTFSEETRVARLYITPFGENWRGETVMYEYNFADNPPMLPPEPTIEINDKNILSVNLTNLESLNNADSIEVSVYQNYETLYHVGKTVINTAMRRFTYEVPVEAGHKYTVRLRAVRGKIYGGYTNFTNEELTVPSAPSDITELKSVVNTIGTTTKYGVFISWNDVVSATHYRIEYTRNINDFDFNLSEVQSVETTPEQGLRAIINDIEKGFEYFFRVKAINSKGSSEKWSPIKSIKFGSKPSVPTTWSDKPAYIIGETLRLYWRHNSSDGSESSSVRIKISITKPSRPTPVEIIKVINKPTDNYFVLDANDTQFTDIVSGGTIRWCVQTSGIDSTYSDWSQTRELNVFVNPTISIVKLRSNRGIDNDFIIDEYPIHFKISSRPYEQKPISYNIQIRSKQDYKYIDNKGNDRNITSGTIIYNKHYDPRDEKITNLRDKGFSWINIHDIIYEINPSDVFLNNNTEYELLVIVVMNSGLSAYIKQDIQIDITDVNNMNIESEFKVNDDDISMTIRPKAINSDNTAIYQNNNPWFGEYITATSYYDEDGSIVHEYQDTRKTTKPIYNHKQINKTTGMYITDKLLTHKFGLKVLLSKVENLDSIGLTLGYYTLRKRANGDIYTNGALGYITDNNDQINDGRFVWIPFSKFNPRKQDGSQLNSTNMINSITTKQTNPQYKYSADNIFYRSVGQPITYYVPIEQDYENRRVKMLPLGATVSVRGFDFKITPTSLTNNEKTPGYDLMDNYFLKFNGVSVREKYHDNLKWAIENDYIMMLSFGYMNLTVPTNKVSIGFREFKYTIEPIDGSPLDSIPLDNTSLSVYRIDRDLNMIEIAKDINNEKNIQIVDPHPSLVKSNYRIIAQNNNTGVIYIKDFLDVNTGNPVICIQWGQTVNNFTDGLNRTSGMILKLPYNIDLTESREVEYTTVKYAGKQYPVSYFGIAINETMSLSTDIATSDEETISKLRMLSKWNDKVYLREPSGLGYWCVVKVNFNITHMSLITPVTLDVTRVEGGM